MGVAVFEKSAFEATAFEMARDYVAPASGDTFAVTGNAATPRADRLITSPGNGYNTTGWDATTLATRYAALATVPYIYTGEPARVARELTLYANDNAFTLTGYSARTIADRKFISDVGYFNYTGWSVNVPFGRHLRMYPGAYTEAGQNLDFRATRLLTPAKGSYNWTIGARGPFAARYLEARHDFTGVFQTNAFYTPAFQGDVLLPHQVTGSPMSFRRDAYVGLDKGTYLYTGRNAGLFYGRVASAFGSYSVVGEDVGLFADRYFGSNAGTYALVSGQNNLLRQYPLRANRGTYILTGRDVRFLETIWTYPDLEVIGVPWEPQKLSVTLEDRWIIVPADDTTVGTELVQEMPTRPRRRVI